MQIKRVINEIKIFLGYRPEIVDIEDCIYNNYNGKVLDVDTELFLGLTDLSSSNRDWHIYNETGEITLCGRRVDAFEGVITVSMRDFFRERVGRKCSTCKERVEKASEPFTVICKMN